MCVWAPVAYLCVCVVCKYKYAGAGHTIYDSTYQHHYSCVLRGFCCMLKLLAAQTENVIDIDSNWFQLNCARRIGGGSVSNNKKKPDEMRIPFCDCFCVGGVCGWAIGVVGALF